MKPIDNYIVTLKNLVINKFKRFIYENVQNKKIKIQLSETEFCRFFAFCNLCIHTPKLKSICSRFMFAYIYFYYKLSKYCIYLDFPNKFIYPWAFKCLLLPYIYTENKKKAGTSKCVHILTINMIRLFRLVQLIILIFYI